MTTTDMSYDDQHDDYDDIDDEYPDPGVPGGFVGDAETLLRRAIDIIATAPTMPLSSSPRIDRDEMIELLEESLHRLPEELRQARWMLKERQEFVAKTRREADELLEAARVRAERMVQRTEVVRAAEQRARQVMETAEADSRRLKHETEDFLDQRLGSFEILLDKLGKTVHAEAAFLPSPSLMGLLMRLRSNFRAFLICPPISSHSYGVSPCMRIIPIGKSPRQQV
jgi:F0F1-type ATP synthase membrane subunit b/b'